MSSIHVRICGPVRGWVSLGRASGAVGRLRCAHGRRHGTIRQWSGELRVGGEHPRGYECSLRASQARVRGAQHRRKGHGDLHVHDEDGRRHEQHGQEQSVQRAIQDDLGSGPLERQVLAPPAPGRLPVGRHEGRSAMQGERRARGDVDRDRQDREHQCRRPRHRHRGHRSGPQREDGQPDPQPGDRAERGRDGRCGIGDGRLGAMAPRAHLSFPVVFRRHYREWRRDGRVTRQNDDVAKGTTKPGFIPPMLATLVAAPFDDPDWLFEVKWDGFRVEAVVDGDSVRLWTRGEQDASRYFGPFLDPPTWLARATGRRRRRGHRARRARRARLRAAPGADQGEGRGRRAEPVRVRGLRPPPPRRPVAPRRAARGAPPAPGVGPARGPARPAERAHRGRRDRVLRSGPDARPRGDHGQGPAARRTCRASAPIAGRRSRSARSRSSSSAAGRRAPARAVDLGRAAGRRLRGRRAPLRRQGRRRVHGRPPGRAARGARPAGGRGVAVRAAGPACGRPRRATGSDPSSSSAPSSPAGRATASSVRRRTRASSSRRTRARSSGSARARNAGS